MACHCSLPPPQSLGGDPSLTLPSSFVSQVNYAFCFFFSRYLSRVRAVFLKGIRAWLRGKATARLARNVQARLDQATAPRQTTASRAVRSRATAMRRGPGGAAGQGGGKGGGAGHHERPSANATGRAVRAGGGTESRRRVARRSKTDRKPLEGCSH